MFRHRASHLSQRLAAARQRAYLERVRLAGEDAHLVAQQEDLEVHEAGVTTDLIAEAEQCLRRLARLCDACDEYLRHPEDADRYDLSPRAEEIMVTYSDDGGPRKRAALAELLARVPAAVRRDRIELEGADPRRLLVQASARIHAQLQLLAQLDGRIEAAPDYDPSTNRDFSAIRTAVMEALEPFPEARQAVINRLFREIHGIQALEAAP